MRILMFLLILILMSTAYVAGKVDGKFDGFSQICGDKIVVKDYMSGLVKCLEEINKTEVFSSDGFNYKVVEE